MAGYHDKAACHVKGEAVVKWLHPGVELPN